MTTIRQRVYLTLMIFTTVMALTVPRPVAAQSTDCQQEFEQAIRLLEEAKQEAASGVTRISLEAIEAAQQVVGEILTRCGGQAAGALTAEHALDSATLVKYPEGWTSLKLRTSQSGAVAAALSSAGPGLLLLVFQPTADRDLREIYLVVGTEQSVMRELMGGLAPDDRLRDLILMLTFMSQRLDARKNPNTAWRFGDVRPARAGTYPAAVATVTTLTYKGAFVIAELYDGRYAFALGGAASGTAEAMEALTLSIVGTIAGKVR